MEEQEPYEGDGDPLKENFVLVCFTCGQVHWKYPRDLPCEHNLRIVRPDEIVEWAKPGARARRVESKLLVGAEAQGVTIDGNHPPETE